MTLDCINGPTLEITTSLKQFSYFLCPVGFSHHCLLNNAEMDAPICPFSLEKNKSTYVVCLAEGYTEVFFFFFYEALCRPARTAGGAGEYGSSRSRGDSSKVDCLSAVERAVLTDTDVKSN